MRKISFLLLVLTINASATIINIPADYPTIQQGIESAQPGDTILVADGIYYEQISIVSKKPLLVTSNFLFDGDSTHLLNTIIDGRYLQSPNQTVVFFHHVDTTVILAGFTIQNGRGTEVSGMLLGGGIRLYYSGAKIIHNRIINNILNGGPAPFGRNCNARGAGIVCNNPYFSWVVLSDNIISHNQCISNKEHAYGAGAYIRDDTRFSGNILSDNSAISKGYAHSEGAGIFVDGTNFIPVTFIATNNKITGNIAQSEALANGAGVLSFRAMNIIADNEVINNECMSFLSFGGGVKISSTSLNSIVRNNLFIGNKAYRSGALEIYLETESDVLIENNSFFRNIANTAGAMYTRNGSLSILNNVFKCNVALDNDGGALRFYKSGEADNNAVLVNNTFSGNTARMGGAIYSYNSNPILMNNIIWNNMASTASEIYVSSGNVSLAYCDVNASMIEGDAIIFHDVFNTDPMFCDTSCLSIGCNSPCKNAGIDAYTFGTKTIYAPAYDNRKTIRPLEGAFDIGAFEFDSTLVAANKIQDLVAFTVYPNPGKDKIYCRYRIEKDANVSFILYDLLGNSVYSRQNHQKAGDHNVPLHLNGLTRGVYLLKLQAGEKVEVKKVVIN